MSNQDPSTLLASLGIKAPERRTTREKANLESDPSNWVRGVRKANASTWIGKREAKNAKAWIAQDKGEQHGVKPESYPDPTEMLIKAIEPLKEGTCISAKPDKGKQVRICLENAARYSNERHRYNIFSIYSQGTVIKRRKR